MSFNSRSQFITAQASEKITLAHVEARQRILPWSLVSGTLYKKTVNYYVIKVHDGLTELAEAADSLSVTSGKFFYDSQTNELFININADPENSEIIATYRLFFSSAPITLPHNLSVTGKRVRYDGRIQLAPPFKHKIGVQQNLVSIIGNGSLKLINNDGGLDEIYDTLIFDNQAVYIYSWNRELPVSDAKIIYRGKVTNKRFQPDNVAFEVKDQLIDLDQNIPQIPYDDDDNVDDSVKGTYKRWVYGRVDGLKLQSIDQIANGYSLTGTLRADSADVFGQIIKGIGTLFLSELSPGDAVKVGDQEFTVETIAFDDYMTVSESEYRPFSGLAATVVPEIPTTSKNREFFIADHASAEVSTIVTESLQLNRIVVVDASAFRVGDIIEFNGGERVEIKSIFENKITLVQNLLSVPSVGSSVIRRPVQRVYIGSILVPEEEYTVTNLGSPTNETRLTFTSDVEFNIARIEGLGFSATFTNGLKTITTTDDIDLREILNPRDWIRPNNISYTTFYEILSVEEQSITIRTNFADPTITDNVDGKRPDYIGDDTIISAEVLGRTENG